jgi:hypothetical protein
MALTRLRAPLFALALAALALALGLAHAHHTQHEFISRFDRYSQPGFDARVYMAMSEAPAFFTVEPWGYRLLSPWLVHLLSDAPDAGAFTAVTLVALFAAGLLLFTWLRRLGHAPFAAALGVAAFAFSPPVSRAVRDPFLAEPLLAVLLMLFLLALEARAGLATLALVAALGALGKDLFLFLLPVVFFVRRTDVGARRALAETAVVVLPAAALTWLLRAWWTPYLPDAGGGLPGAGVFWLALWRILEGAPKWVGSALLMGVAPLALVALFTIRARPFLWRYGWLLAITWALPFAASVYTDDTASVPFFADDIPRLLLYALPATLHLALLTLERAGLYAAPEVNSGAAIKRGAAAPRAPGHEPHGLQSPCRPVNAGLAAAPWGGLGARSEAEPPSLDDAGQRPGRVSQAHSSLVARTSRPFTIAAALLTAAVVAFPLIALDRYRRVDLRGPRDGPLLLALCRQSLAFARRLEAGRTVAYDVRARRFRPGKDLPRYLERMRWFLRDGWGDLPHYAGGPALMRARTASVLIPCLRPDDWTLTLTLNAPAPSALGVSLNGRELHRAAFEGELRLKVRVPAAALFRGDNLLTLAAADDDPRIELVDLRIQPQRR